MEQIKTELYVGIKEDDLIDVRKDLRTVGALLLLPVPRKVSLRVDDLNVDLATMLFHQALQQVPSP